MSNIIIFKKIELGKDIYILGIEKGKSITGIFINGHNQFCDCTDNLFDLTYEDVSFNFKSTKIDKNSKFLISLPELSLIFIHKENLTNVIKIDINKNSIKHIPFKLFEKYEKMCDMKKNVKLISSKTDQNKKIKSNGGNRRDDHHYLNLNQVW